MVAYLYDFNGTDTAAGSGVPSPTGHPVLEVISGSWRRLSNRAHTDTAASSSPILAAPVGGGDADVTVDVSSGGGDAVYLRVTDAANWIRARVRRYTTTSTYYYTEYEWRATYTYSYGDPPSTSHTHTSTAWSSSSSNPPSFDDGYLHNHTAWHKHDLSSVSTTGNTRQASSSSSSTAYQVILEKCVAGSVTTLATKSVSAPNKLRTRAQGTSLKVYVNGSSTASITVTESTFTTVNKHGIGRGPSDQTGHALDNLILDPINTPPNAPNLNWPSVVDIASTTRLQHVFSDPDAGDSQSKFDLRYRPVSTSAWTEITVTGPNPWWDAPGGTFTPGDYEGQVLTYDAQGVAGPWSTSSFFTAAAAPDTPIVTSPTAGGTVTEDDAVTWSTPDQDSYQVRRVADNAGAPDTATVYFDTGTVSSAATRTLALHFETNNRTEHVQVRVQKAGLWSPWASVDVDVTYTPPPAPVVTLTGDTGTGSLNVAIANPTAGAGQPDVVYNDVFIDDGDGLERKATELAPNAGFRYMTPRSGRNYAPHLRVIAVGDNGTTSSNI